MTKNLTFFSLVILAVTAISIFIASVYHQQKASSLSAVGFQKQQSGKSVAPSPKQPDRPAITKGEKAPSSLQSRNKKAVLTQSGNESPNAGADRMNGQIVGHVLDQRKNPIAGAKVSLFEVSMEDPNYRILEKIGGKDIHQIHGISDKQGRFVIENIIPEAEYMLKASAPGYAIEQTNDVSIEQTPDVEIILGKGFRVSGRVVTAEGKRPLAGVKIQLICTFEYPYDSMETKTNYKGEFEILHVPWLEDWYLCGEYQTRDGMLIIDKVYLSAVKDQLDRLELMANPTMGIYGKVLMKETGEPVPLAEVSVYRQDPESGYFEGDGPEYGGNPLSSTTDARGGYSLRGILAGTCRLQARKAGFLKSEFEEVTIQNKKSLSGISLSISRGVSISGVILDHGNRPAANMRVKTQWGEKYPDNTVYYSENAPETDSAGKFTLSGFPMGDYSFRAVVRDHRKGLFGESDEIALTSSTRKTEAIIRAQPGGSIFGKVVDKKGNAIARAEVSASFAEMRIGPEDKIKTLTDDQGRFRLAYLEPGANRVVAKTEFAEKEQTVNIAPGQAVNTEIILDIPQDQDEASKSIKGVLVDLNGKKLVGWQVETQIGDPTNLKEWLKQDHFKRDKTDVQGRFELNGFKDGEGGYLSFKHNDIHLESGAIEAGDNEQVFILPLGGTIKGRLLYKDTRKPVMDANMELKAFFPAHDEQYAGTKCHLSGAHIYLRPDENGEFEVSQIPLCTYRMKIECGNAASKMIYSINVDAPALTDLGDIYLSREAFITGRLIDGATGQPFVADINEPNRRNRKGEPYYSQIVAYSNEAGKIDGLYANLNATTGLFKADKIPPDTSLLVFHSPDNLWAWVNPPALSPGKTTDIGDVRLVEGDTIKGRLLGPNGEIANFASVSVKFECHNFTILQNAMTNGDGEFMLKGVLPGPAQLFARADIRQHLSPWIRAEDKRAPEISDYEITIPKGGIKNFEIRFPAQQTQN